MNSDVGEESNDMDEPPVVTLGELLRKRVSIPALASAIEKRGIYGWDRYGRFGSADESQRNVALDLLAKQRAWEGDPLSRPDEDPRSPLELSEDFNGPFDHYGWPADQLPDFEAVGRGLIDRPGDAEKPAKRKAPDEFVVALIRLLVDIAKREPNLDVNKMPGTKKDLHELASRVDADLKCSLSTFATYIKPLIKFERGSRSCSYYRNLFPEHFK